MNFTMLMALLSSPFGMQLMQGLFGNGQPQNASQLPNASQQRTTQPVASAPELPPGMTMSPPIIEGNPVNQPPRAVTTQPVAQRTPGFGDGFGSFGSFEPGSGTPALQGAAGFDSGGTHNPNVGGQNGTTGSTYTNPGMGQGLGQVISSKFMPGLSGLYGGGSMGLQTMNI